MFSEAFVNEKLRRKARRRCSTATKRALDRRHRYRVAHGSAGSDADWRDDLHLRTRRRGAANERGRLFRGRAARLVRLVGI